MNRVQTDQSLSEVHESVDTTTPRKGWKRILAYIGPAYLVSVGYMDPGNWATDLQGGSRFGYQLIWVLLMSNLMALLLQGLSARLGIVRRRDLAQANRETYPPLVNFCLYILAELAIAATDLAEVLGMAIGINLLTGLPLIWGTVITLLDTFLFFCCSVTAFAKWKPSSLHWWLRSGVLFGGIVSRRTSPGRSSNRPRAFCTR